MFSPKKLMVMSSVFFTLFLFGCTSTAETNAFPLSPLIRYLSSEDFSLITEGMSLDALNEEFGEPMQGDLPAVAWPKLEQKGTMTNLELWKRGYWFFFKKTRGRVTRPYKLEYIASLKEDSKSIDKPLLDLIPFMTIDWPKPDQGNLLIQKY